MQTSVTSCLNLTKWPAELTVMTFLRKKCWHAFQVAKKVPVCHIGLYCRTSSPSFYYHENYDEAAIRRLCLTMSCSVFIVYSNYVFCVQVFLFIFYTVWTPFCFF